MEDKILLRFKTKNIRNFYEIEPRSPISFYGTVKNSTRSLMVAEIDYNGMTFA